MTTSQSTHRRSRWNALKSGYHAFGGLLWVGPRTPSLQLGVVVVIMIVGLGFLVRLPLFEVATLVLIGTMLLAVETINTAVEMVCDFVMPDHDPRIGKIKDVAAGATAVTEIGAALILLLVLGPRLFHLVWH